MSKRFFFLFFFGMFLVPPAAQAECTWTVTWRNHGSGLQKIFPVTEEEGVRFGLETDFLCIVTPVAPLQSSPSRKQKSLKHIDMNCRYAEGERSMATGLAAYEEQSARESVHLFLTDQLGETSHSMTLKLLCP